MRAVSYLDQARDEFLREVNYFATISQALAERFDAAVRKAEAFAAEFAEAGAPYEAGTRRLVLSRFKFSVVYLARPDEIVIVAVAPSRRKPGYWQSRVGSA